MSPDQDDGSRPRVAASIPQNQKYALDVLANDRSKPGNRTYVADLIREAIEEYLWNTAELPPEAKDALDGDLQSDSAQGVNEADV